MGSYQCPRCNGSGKESQTVISWSTGKTEEQKVSCGKCGGSGSVNTYGNPTLF